MTGNLSAQGAVAASVEKCKYDDSWLENLRRLLPFIKCRIPAVKIMR